MEFEEDNPKENLTEDPDRQIDSDGIENETSGKNICQHFLLGKCHFGDRCRLSHSVLDVPVDVPETTQLEEDDTEKQNKTRKNRKKMQTEKKEKPHINEGLEKKSRMRTADDVISRILWDSSVDPADFMVGHLDRFLGVLERPFSDFSWDTQVCDCDFSEELALPRHRIQYFSYKGQRVWDKDSRTDRVFGSTGQSIVPPFGVEDQQQENLTPDTGEQEEAPNLEDVSSDLDRVASECSEEHDNISTTITKSKHELEDAVQHSSNENAQDGTCNETLLSQNEAAHEDLTQLAKDLSVTQKEGPTEIEEKWKDSWDTVENSEQVSFVLPAPKSYRSPRQPTHFICFRVDSPAALKAFQCVQRKVLSHLPQSEPLWLDPATLHVTLCLLVLNSPEEVSSAAKLMCTTIRNSHKPPISVSFPPKLKHFHGTVLHVAPQPTSDVQSLNSPLQEVFKEKGWLHRHSRCPTYHLTLAKARERMTEKMFEGIGSLKLPKDVNFGKLEVNKLYLCEIGRRRTESSFYEVVCAVQLPNV